MNAQEKQQIIDVEFERIIAEQQGGDAILADTLTLVLASCEEQGGGLALMARAGDTIHYEALSNL